MGMADPFTMSLCPNRYGWDNRMPGGRMIELEVEENVEYILEPENPFNYSAKGKGGGGGGGYINVAIHVLRPCLDCRGQLCAACHGRGEVAGESGNVGDFITLTPVPRSEHDEL